MISVVVFNGVPRPIAVDAIATGRGFVVLASNDAGRNFCAVNSTSLRGGEYVLFHVTNDGTSRLFARYFSGIRVVIFVPYAPINRRNFLCDL